MRVLHVIGRLGMGGDTATVCSAIDIMTSISELNTADIDFLTHDIGYKKEFVKKMEELGHHVHVIPGDMRKMGPVKYYHAVKKLLQDKGPYDVLHVHTSLQSAIVLKAGKDCDIPVRICHAHTNSIQRSTNPVNRLILTPVFRHMIHNYATDKVACGIMAGHFLFPKDSFTILKNGVNLFEYKNCNDETVHALKKELNIPDDAYIIGNVGRFSEMKNHKFMLELARSLKDDPSVYFVMVGDGENFEEIKGTVAKEGLNVILTGRRSDVPVFMSMFHVLLIPSLPGEGFSITMLEAEAAGCPCLVADTLPTDADMGLGLVQFLSLQNKNIWLQAIKKRPEKRRKEECIQTIQKAGYDKFDSALEWISFYNK